MQKKNQRNQKVKILFLFVIQILSFSCASKPKIRGEGELCGIVIDENNQPVKEFVISCKRKNGMWKSVLTDENGLFVFSEAAFGEYTFKGWKTNYLQMKENLQTFYDKRNMFCFQVSSLNFAFDCVDEMLLCRDFDKALELINQIESENNPCVEKVLKTYEQVLFAKNHEIKDGEKNL